MSWIDAQGKEHKQIVAEHDAVVFDETVGFDRQIVAGKPVPPELEEAYKNQSGQSESVEKEDARKTASRSTSGHSKATKAESSDS